MSTCQELVTIYERIAKRVDKGSEDFVNVLKILDARVQAELKIVGILKEMIPVGTEEKDQITTALIEELKNEVNHHIAFSKELKERIVTPAQTYMSTMRDKQKEIQSRVKRQSDVVKKAIKETESAQKELDAQKAKFQTAKTDAQQKKVQKAQMDLQKKIQQEGMTATKESSGAVPTLHRDFSTFDSTRLAKMQQAAIGFERLKQKMNSAINEGAQIAAGKMDNFDCADRSSRYISRVFDTSTEEVAEHDPELGVVAIADYRSEDPRDLQFCRGDRIKVLCQHNSGWWEGQLGPMKGTFPRTFVMMPGEQENKNDQIGAVFLAVRDTKKDRGGDVELLAGDLVYVDWVQKGRCSGTNLRTRKRGYFPLDALEQRI